MIKLKLFWHELLKILPTLWGVIWVLTVTVGSLTLLIVTLKWLFTVCGVI